MTGVAEQSRWGLIVQGTRHESHNQPVPSAGNAVVVAASRQPREAAHGLEWHSASASQQQQINTWAQPPSITSPINDGALAVSPGWRPKLFVIFIPFRWSCPIKAAALIQSGTPASVHQALMTSVLHSTVDSELRVQHSDDSRVSQVRTGRCAREVFSDGGATSQTRHEG